MFQRLVCFFFHCLVVVPTQQIAVPPTPTGIPPVSMRSLFSSDHTWVLQLPKEKTMTLISTGDVIPARSVNMQMTKRNDFLWPFRQTADLLKNADLTVINLETPLMKDCNPTETGMVFCGNAKGVDGLVYAGVDIATIKNNHIGNYGQEGIESTRKILLDNGISPVGEMPITKEIKNMKFSFLAYNDIGFFLNREQIKKDITSIKKISDVVVVSFHWGEEYTSTPSARQVELAHASIDAGADIILGNHPHWIQPVELYENKFIIYAHGNFVFDQEWSPETKIGVVGRYTFYDKKLVDVEFIPTKIRDYGQAYVPQKEDASLILREFQNINKEFDNHR